MRILFLVISLISSLAHAQEWKDTWVVAMESMESKNWAEAEIALDQVIACIEENKDVHNPHVYIDRARLRCIVGKYQEASEDVSMALASPNLNAFDRSIAILVRQQIHANTGQHHKLIDDMNEFRDTYPHVPKMEFANKKLYIRNLPDCECSHWMIKTYLISSGLCESENDMKILSSGLFLANIQLRDCDCVGGCDDYDINVHSDPEIDKRRCAPSCKDLCDQFAAAGQAWCGRGFGYNLGCLLSCSATVEALRQTCHTCCNTGNFYLHCLKPFEDILGAMGNGCDPLWD